MKRKLTIYCLLFVLTSQISCNLIFRSTKRTFKKNSKDLPYDVIIVPGYPYDGKQWNKVIKMRVVWAKYLYDNGYTKNIIFSGSAVYTPYIESRVFKAFAVAKGVPNEAIFTEERARHSVENIYYSYQIAKEKGFEKMALATDAFQTNNMRRFIKKYELEVNLLPIIMDTLLELDLTEPQINPTPAMVDNFISITESESLFKRLSGTFGYQIIWEEEDLKKKRFKKKLKR